MSLQTLLKDSAQFSPVSLKQEPALSISTYYLKTMLISEMGLGSGIVIIDSSV